ncbi:cold shock domain-containing protein [Streptomyces monashensis]|uniref:cold-shock protein n=1 Tax=Streptomyces monashensis TaxID=1678012 RepID=UPI0033D39117
MPSGVVKWFDRERGRGDITRNGGGEITAQRPAVCDGAERGLVAGRQVRFDVTRDADGDWAENISRQAPGRSRPTGKGQAGPPVWPVQSVPGGDVADTCPWCVRIREADTAEQ